MFRSAFDSPPIPLPLLITGVAGVAGYNALEYFQERYPGRVIGIRQRDNWRLTGGYRALILSDVALPYGQIPYRFSDLQEVGNINSNDTLLLHGIFAGLEYNW